MDTLKKIAKFLDGWKLFIGVAITVAVSAYDHATGHSYSSVVGTLLTLIGYGPAGMGIDGSFIGSLVGAVMILWGGAHKLYKANEQRKAGANLSDLLSTDGYISKVVADSYKDQGEK